MGQGPLCQCGCGEYLPEGSTRQFKRGHKENAGNGGLGSKPSYAAFSPDSEFFSGSDDAENIYSAPGTYTIEHARQSVENDPEPAGMAEPKSRVSIKVTPSIRKDIEGKVAFMLMTTANLVQLTDPSCGGVMLDNSANIAAKLTPVLCQSQGVVQWFRKGGNFLMYVNLMVACAPVIAAVYAHHLAGAKPEEMPSVAYTDEFYGVS